MPNPLVPFRDAILSQFSDSVYEKRVETFSVRTHTFSLTVSVDVANGRIIVASATRTDRMTQNELDRLKRADELVHGQLSEALIGSTSESEALAIVLKSLPPTPRRPRIVPIRHYQASLTSDDAGYVKP